MSMKLRCGVVTTNPFPIGNVSTLRYSSYMKSLSRVADYTKVYIFTPSRTAKYNKDIRGTHQGIAYEYTAKKITWTKENVIMKYIVLLKGLLNCWWTISNDKINVLILYGDNPLIINLYFAILCRIKNIRFYGDRSEYPNKRHVDTLWKQKLYSFKMKWFDGMIVMTSELKSYYSQYFSDSSQLFMLPMTIDNSRFANTVKRNNNDKYIAVVFGVHNRDGLMESIKAFVNYRELGGTYTLLLVGDYEHMPNKDELDLFLKSCDYLKYVKICGALPINDIPQILTDASCLLTTPNTYVSGGFPTKFGEYMLSGTPIVSTSAGDLTKYVIPGHEALFSAPGDIVGISHNLLYVENNPHICYKIAQNAKNKVIDVFNADTYVNELHDFLIGV